MTTSKIAIIEGVPMVQLTTELLGVLGVEAGDEIEITIADQTLSLRATAEATRKAKMRAIMDELFVRRDSVYRQLAEGVK
jgi:antitoxin component of MazEF toxin-antitoxin module